MIYSFKYILFILLHISYIFVNNTVIIASVPHYASLVDFIQEKPNMFAIKKQTAEEILREQPTAIISQTDAHLLFSNIYNRSLRLRLLLSLQLPFKGLSSLYQVGKTWLYGASLYPADSAIRALLEREYRYNNQEYYILYHATTLTNYAMHYIDTSLYNLNEHIIKNTDNYSVPQSYLILRQPSPNQPQESIAIQKSKREQYIKQGVGFGWNALKRHQRYLMSCNYALSGNNARMRSGESSLEYWLLNFNLDVLGTIYKPFDLIYAKYPEIKLFAKQYTPAFNEAINNLHSQALCGVMIQIIFKSSDLLRACVYTSSIGGYKTGIWLHGDRYISDPVEILQAITHTPYLIDSNIDIIQFRLILTDDLLLDPSHVQVKNNIEMYAQTVNQEALETFHDKIKSIMSTIIEDYKNPAYWSK
ncbi:MAG TPA: hypothetical protein VGW78_00880 [Candidatus Babeliales bacterium]|jgi:hypothetical protein|nr:hypothetical protein [Candidatus Babeliales bacterium]